MNSKGHLVTSLIKSAIRIVGCIWAGINHDVTILAIYFTLAEVLGVCEELMDKRG